VCCHRNLLDALGCLLSCNFYFILFFPAATEQIPISDGQNLNIEISVGDEDKNDDGAPEKASLYVILNPSSLLPTSF